jgi:multidrug efflux pump subunit AcrB
MRLAFAIALTTAVGCHRLKATRARPLFQPTVEIRVEVPGQRPSEIETAVSVPVARAVTGEPHVARVRAASEPGRSTVTVQLDPGADLGAALPAISERLKAVVALLPANASAPVLARRDGPLVARYVLSKDLIESGGFEWLNRAEGVGAVTTCGNDGGDVTLNINAYALSSQGMTAADVAKLLASLRPLSSPGLRQLVLGYYNATPVRLGDVATITDGASASGCSAFDDQGTPVVEADVFALPSVEPAGVRANLSEALRRSWIERPVTSEVRSVGPARIVTVDFTSTATFPAIAKTISAAVRSVDPGTRFILEIEAPDGPDGPPTSGRLVLGTDSEVIDRGVTAALLTTPTVAAAGEANATLELVASDRATLAPATSVLCRRLREGGLLVSCPGVTQRIISVPQVDRDLARTLDVSMSDVALTLDAVRGRLRFALAAEGTTISWVRLRLVASLDHLNVKTRSGGLVPLSAFVKMTTEPLPSLLQLENKRPFTSARVHANDLSALKNIFEPPPGIELRVIPD